MVTLNGAVKAAHSNARTKKPSCSRSPRWHGGPAGWWRLVKPDIIINCL